MYCLLARGVEILWLCLLLAVWILRNALSSVVTLSSFGSAVWYQVCAEKKIIASAEQERYKGRLVDWELPDCSCM